MSLKNIRQSRKLSQSQLANLSGVNVRMIQQYEQNVRDLNHAQIETLLSLSLALKCKIKHIITDQKLKILLNEYENMRGE